MASLGSHLLVVALRISLFAACRTLLLPLLFGEARHASLDLVDDDDGAPLSPAEVPLRTLPSPATASRRAGAAAAHTRSSSSTAPQLLFNLIAPHSASALLFALSFEESSLLFLLVLLEALGLDGRVLRAHWRLSLLAVLALAVLLIPLGICALFTLRVDTTSPLSRRILWAMLPFLAWLALFLRVPLPSAMASVSSLLDAALARTAVLGVTLIALLSGSAAAASAVDTWDAFFNKHPPRPPTAQDERTAHESYVRARQDLKMRKEALAALRARPDEEQLGLLGRIWGGTRRDKEAASLTSEITGLEMLARAMRDDYDAILSLRRAAQWSRTLHGRFLLFLGHCFSLYCLWRCFSALLNLILLGYSDAAPPDFVAWGIAHLFALFNAHVDLQMWTRQISLLFVGALIALRMRVVLSGLGAFFRAASTGVSTGFLILFLAEVLTIYLLATLIQLRTALPPSFSVGDGVGAGVGAGVGDGDGGAQQPLAPLLSTLPSFAVVFGALFDAGFLLSALATGLHRYITRGDSEPVFGRR